MSVGEINGISYKRDNSFLWAFLVFINSHLFYLAPAKIYFDNNTDVSLVVKSLVVLVFMLLASRHILSLGRFPLVVIVLVVSLFHGVQDKEVFISLFVPIMMGLAMMNLNSNRFFHNYYKITKLFWVLYGAFFVAFYELITTYDLFVTHRYSVDGLYSDDRGGLGFISPNNIGVFLSVAAVSAFIVDKYREAILFLGFSLFTYVYTGSRTSVGVVLVLSICFYVARNAKKPDTIFALMFLGVLSIFLSILLILSLSSFDNFRMIDLLLSHRLHYTELILKPSLFGTPNLHGLDMSLFDILNKGGAVVLLIYIVILYRVLKLGSKQALLVLLFLTISMAENIVNQYFMLVPLIFMLFFTAQTKVGYGDFLRLFCK